MAYKTRNYNDFNDYLNTYSNIDNCDIDVVILDTFLIENSNTSKKWSIMKPFLFIRIVTANGTEGWGEAHTLLGDDNLTINYIHELAEIIKLQPMSPWKFFSLINSHEIKSSDMNYCAARSAIEMALWDIYGKQSGKPLNNLIGKSTDKYVPVYANIWSNQHQSDEAIINKAVSVINDGFLAIKIYPLQGRNVTQAAYFVKNLRSTIGDNIEILVDLACPDNERDAIDLEPLIIEYKPYWYEEPTDGQNIKLLSMIKGQSKLAIVTGESQCDINHFKAILDANAADILNPEIAAIGGITKLLEIAVLADECEVKISPHCWNSMSIAMAVMLHLCSIMPNSDKAEIFPDYFRCSNQFMDYNFKLYQGKIQVPKNAGIGVSLDVKKLQETTSNIRTTFK